MGKDPSARGTAAILGVIGQNLLDQGDRIFPEMSRAIREKVVAYQSGALVSEDDLLAANRANTVILLEALGTGKLDSSPAVEVGRLRARQGVPLADVMSAYREGSRFLWEEVAQIARALGESQLSWHDLLVTASELWLYQSEFTDAMAAAYREVVTAQLIEREQERSALVGGLLDGRLPAQTTAWDAVRLLGLPESEHFVVVAAGVGMLGGHPLRGIESTLRHKELRSAWRLEPDLHIGVVALPSPDQLPRLQQALDDYPGQRIGVSPVYDSVPPPGIALNYAKAALRAATEEEPVVVFDTSPYSVAAITDPHTMAHYAELVLGPLNLLDPTDKAVLLDTFRQWVAHDGSVSLAAHALYCHPNTVRYRLRRLKDHTGRDITRPRDIAELCLAVEAEHRLAPSAPGTEKTEEDQHGSP